MTFNPIQITLIIVITTMVIIAALFGFILMLLNFMTYDGNVVQQRLAALKQNKETEDVIINDTNTLLGGIKTLLFKIAAPLAKNLYSQNTKHQKKIKSMLSAADLPDSDQAVWQYLSIQVASGICLSVVLFFASLFFTPNMAFNIFFGILGLFVGRTLMIFVLKSKVTKRQNEIRHHLPDILDLMVVCVEAGLALDATIQRVAEDVEAMAYDLSTEFKRLNRELNAGVPRGEAFHSLGNRSGVEELKSLCSLIIQSDKLGTSIADSLRIYADDMRVRRKQRAEELAAKASIKMTFPLVLFIFPPLFIVLLGPTVIQAIKTFGLGK